MAPVWRGQFETASVLGTVKEPNGADVPKARVILLNVNNGTSQEAETDAAGDSQVPARQVQFALRFAL